MKIEKIYLTKDNLEKIKNIDDTFYKGKNKSKIDWYLNRYTSNHFAYVIKDDNDNYIGYIGAVPIKKELYEAFIKGVLINDIDINPQMFVEKSKYFYIISFVILEEYRHQGLGLKLIKNIIKTIDKGRYIALTVSKEGEVTAKKFMHLKKQINDDIAVFEIKF